MIKPTIFFSHSSADRDYISKLKEIISRRTSKTIEVFQSSDGESIPFGNNWVHKIEENLNKATIMFVFVSPKSSLSSWIYFESGFAYSKKIKVIPIGICGIDIGTIRPPLNLLQGFNINNENGLGNLITVINREFSTEFDESFNKEEYIELSMHDDFQEAHATANHIDKVNITLSRKVSINSEQASICVDALEKISNFFSKEAIQSHTSQLFGSEIKIYSHGIRIHNTQNGDIEISISIDSIQMYEELINILPSLYEPTHPKGWIRLIPRKESRVITDDISLSAKLHKQGLALADIGHNFYTACGMNIKTFKSDNRSLPSESEYVLINFDSGTFKTKSLHEVVSILADAKVLYTP